MSSWIVPAVVAVAVVALIVKRLVGEPLNARDLALPPLVLVGIGVYTVAKVDHLTTLDVAWTVGGAVVGLAFGAVRGTTVRLFARDGVLWQRYSGWTFAVWLGSLAVSLGLGWLAVGAGTNAQARPITLSIGVSLLGELATLGLRALSTGVPFAPGAGNPLSGAGQPGPARRDPLSGVLDALRTARTPPPAGENPSLREAAARLRARTRD
ncbi:DUF1453 domain-containing protein [Longispora sp. NPDC051575]|uniref:DUF1453 domain-containing protein n=1 Tax=Longispora sp. NPDC051575 TaxID=3154943 RepID=UPI0034293533